MPFTTAATVGYAIDAKRARGHLVPDPVDEIAGEPVLARVDQGRWIGDCNQYNPARNRICRGAQLVTPDDQRFWCVLCYNADNQGRWRPVTWPDDPPAIEQALDGQLAPDQNWTP
jgi:hypothetical protein